MALEFTEYGKNLVLRNMFAPQGGAYVFSSNTSAESAVSCPSLGGSNRSSGSLGQNFYIQFYGGTRPNIASVSRSWQASAYSNSTKLWPISTTTALELNSGGILAGSAGSASHVSPSTKLTFDWTNNTVTTSAASLASNLSFTAGTVAWFAVYGGFGTGTISSDVLSNYVLVFTGTVGLSGSGADIEVNRTDIPSTSHPVQITKLSFKFPQPSGVDLIFNKHIYTTALANCISAGTQFNSSSGHIVNFLSSAEQANAKYVYQANANIVNLYTGTRPANPEAAVPGGATLIASINVGSLTYPEMTFVNTSSETSLTKTGTFVGTAVATGNPTWCRIMSNTSGGYASLDCSAGLPGSGSAVIYQDAITSGMPVSLTSLKFSMA